MLGLKGSDCLLWQRFVILFMILLSLLLLEVDAFSLESTFSGLARARRVSQQQRIFLLQNKQALISKPFDAMLPTIYLSPSALSQSQNKDDDSSEADPLGIKRGAYLMVLILALNVWIFSIPTEFRRTRFCTEEQVLLFPDSKCKTFGQWKSQIVDYYGNGGGVKFDFSIEDKEI
jgi:hypothetical protein